MNNFKENMKRIRKVVNFENLSNKEAITVLKIITPAIGNILSDEEVVATWNDRIIVEELKEQGFTEAEISIKASAKGTKNMTDLIGLILDKHELDLYKILGALTNRTVEEVGNADPFDTIEEVADLLNHEVLMGFFQ